MTIASLTESQIYAHGRSAELFDEFATTAEGDGKVYMALLYRSIADGHRTKCESLKLLQRFRQQPEPVH